MLSGLTIDGTVQLMAGLLAAGFILFGWLGWRQISSASRLPFFMLRRDRVAGGWRFIGLALVLALAALMVQFFGRQAAYAIVPPTPSATPTATITQTPTITSTPTITLTPSITFTPTVTPTPTATGTPTLPSDITVLFRETVTPNPQAAFSPIQIAKRLNHRNEPVNPSDTFVQPANELYGAFTYNLMQDGVRWTSLWLRGTSIVCVESKPWDGGTGGYGYTECLPKEGWLPGEYEIQMYVGMTWKVSARFTITAGTVTPTPTGTPEPTATP